MPPPQGTEYLEFETCIAFHVDPETWMRLPAVRKAKMMAHYLHRSMREGYAYEQMLAKTKGKKNDGDGNTTNMQNLSALLDAMKKRGSKPMKGVEFISKPKM